ncbi:serine protease [Streptomyces asoensis]|uniref:serine protease n=1 Tax=Streptomyces asoensis TaxID=249586 RepID=UPI0033D56DC0
MAGRGPRTTGDGSPGYASPADATAHRPAPDAPFGTVGDTGVVRVRDLAGRPRGAGFVADHHGTVITSHEAVDGLARLVLCADGDGGDGGCEVTADAVTPLPGLDLALVRTEGLDVDPLPVTVRDGVEAGRYVRLLAGCWREARVLAGTPVTYTARDRFHPVGSALELAIGTAGRDALRPGGGAAGGPVIDAGTGAVVAVLGTALRSGHRDGGFAVPLRPGGPADEETGRGGAAGAAGAGAHGPLAELLARNAATVPAYGADLNLAGLLELTATSVASDGPPEALPGYAGPTGTGWCPAAVEPVERHDLTREFTAFAAGPATVLALVGAPGSGRTTALAALAARRARGARPAPTLWLRGADLRDGDGSLADAARRALDRAARIVTASRPAPAGTRVPQPTAASTPEEPGRGSFSARASDPAEGQQPGHGSLSGWASGSGERPRPDHGSLSGWVSGSGEGQGPGQRSLSGWVSASGERAGTGQGARAGWGSGSGEGPGSGPGARSDRVPGSGSASAPGPGQGPGQGPGPGPLSGLVPGSGPAAAPAPAPGPAQGAGPGPGPGPRPGWGHGPGPVGTERVRGLGDVTPERLARLAHAVGRPLLLLLDGPEEMPPVLAHRLAEWTEGTADWLRETGIRLVVACRDEYWERAGAEFPPELLYGAVPAGDPLPPCVRVGDLGPDEAREARARYSLPEAALAAPDDRHPLTLRLLSEVRAALPGPPSPEPVDRDDVLSAYLDLMCLRVAVRLAAGNGLRGTAVRRLAAKVSGQVHEAARRSLGPGQGELDRASFEAVFPWGQAPARLGGGTGWASAVLAEGLLVPAGRGYRFAHEELADWIQGVHLDLDEALRALVHRRRPRDGRRPLPVPHHRIGPVAQALLLLARHQGPHQLAVRLRELIHALDADPDCWWAARLLTGTLLRVPDATPYTGVLRLLADLIGAGAGAHGRFVDFGPAFWTRLALPPDARLDLLRRLVLADGGPDDAGAPRYLDTVARLLADDAPAVQPYLTDWFDDERPLPATPHATVATAAQALLHTHRHRAPDDLTEVLVDCAHPRADELLAVLAEEEPSAVCRAADRWSHDGRPARRAAAVTHALRAAPHAGTESDRRLLRRTALALLARPDDHALHGGALALLVRDPETRSRHLPHALELFTAGDPQVPPGVLLGALRTHPDQVLDAFRARLCGPGRADTGAVLRALADITTPALAERVAALVRETVERRPEAAGHVADHVDRRLDQGPAARAVLLPLVTGMLDAGGPEQVRAALAGVLAAPGLPESRLLRDELLEYLLTHEREPAVLDAVLHAAAGRRGEDLRVLVHRTGLLLVRTVDGATRLDRGLVELARHVPGFAARVAEWLTEAPGEWAPLVGPAARRTIEKLAGARVPV